MRDIQSIAVDTPAATLDELCLKFGVWKTARALLRAAWRHRQTKNQITELSNRMRRDIGLPEREDVLLEVRFSLWDIRL
ncbi:DUF1127 domain-containing protein [Rhizobium tubonense]|uniref:DUF1127 domain-containing protein n=1 Tax=Rhizobium tubonense TaxID=484088 RepID=A0A2W4F122_9HYPH|nr:DUF1127 domain-containing protein [Rhizobium tubonense]PZM15690.1 DUF1127 domain-containing protein [Rhizobium tubonense]